MSWWGKLIGGTFGWMLGGPLGALLGTALGHSFDRGIEANRQGGDGLGHHERIQTVFFTATFSVMGHLAKADGRVSEHEIAFARAVMDRMSLTDDKRRLAIELFNQGKAPGFPLDEALEQFRRECGRRFNLVRMFLEIQVQAALADGHLDEAEQRLLLHVFERLGVSRRDFEMMVAMLYAARNFAGGAGAGAGRGGYQPPPSRDLLVEAYKMLGVSAEAGDAEVKRAYRRMMNQHHPDKLVSKGLPEEMVRLATEKTQEIKAAYEQIKQSRGMK